MKPICKDLWKAFILGFLVPAAILVTVVLSGREGEQADVPPETGLQSAPTGPTSMPQTTAPEPTVAPKQYISVLQDGELVEMELENYVLGVVLAEVPTSFEPEALKAQAVAARTVALHFCATGRHDGAVCTSYQCCQSYISPEAYILRGGTAEKLEKAQKSVADTAGQVMKYDGNIICAVYFSCSGGSTEEAVAVWGAEIPYLQAVESPGEEFAEVFLDEIFFSAGELQRALCVVLSGEPENWFGEVTYTAGGGVKTMEIGGVVYKGTTLRALLGLRSTAFTVKIVENLICFETRGYGHRVGMSQYGAQAMAISGKNYVEILEYYYQGAELGEICG